MSKWIFTSFGIIPKKVTLFWLGARNACQEGLDWFEKNFPNGLRLKTSDLVDFATFCIEDGNISYYWWLSARITARLGCPDETGDLRPYGYQKEGEIMDEVCAIEQAFHIGLYLETKQ